MKARDPRRQAPTPAPPKIEAVSTAAAIIDFLAENSDPVGVQQVAVALGMTKSRASRHLANLESLGIVSRQSRRGYRLGWRVIRWGQIALRRLSLAQLLDLPIQRLMQALNRTVLLCVTAGGDAVVLTCIPAKTSIRIEVEAGLVLGLPHSPSALVSFAFQSTDRRERLIMHMKSREPDFRIQDEDAFNKSIASIRRSFYAWTKDKFDLGHGAIAGPVFAQDGVLTAILTIMLPTDELAGRAPPERIVRALMTCCEECSRLLGSRMKFPCLSRNDVRSRSQRSAAIRT